MPKLTKKEKDALMKKYKREALYDIIPTKGGRMGFDYLTDDLQAREISDLRWKNLTQEQRNSARSARDDWFENISRVQEEQKMVEPSYLSSLRSSDPNPPEVPAVASVKKSNNSRSGLMSPESTVSIDSIVDKEAVDSGDFKYVDVFLGAGTITSPTSCQGGELDPTIGSTHCLNAVARGDGDSDHKSNFYVLHAVQLVGMVFQAVSNDSTLAIVPPVIYISLVLDRQTNGAQLNSEDVYVNPSGEILLAAQAMRGLPFFKRFVVLDSVTLTSPQLSMGTDGSSTNVIAGYTIPWELSASLDIVVNTIGSDNTIASILDNSLHVIAYTTPVNGTDPELFYNSRVTFKG